MGEWKTIKTSKCTKCGSTEFLIDETITHLEVDGEIYDHCGKGEFHDRRCAKCLELDSRQ